MKQKKRYEGAYFKKVNKITEMVDKPNFNNLMKYLVSIGDDCRYSWHYLYLSNELELFLKKEQLLLLNLFLNTYSDALTKTDINRIKNRVMKYEVAKRI